MLLMIDNYDSFTYNLVQYFGEIGIDVAVHRNDAIGIDEIDLMQPDQIVISPGPCTPREAGISMQVVEAFAGKIPILGVCLGHQSIAQVFGAEVGHASRLMHGKTSMIYHRGEGVFEGLPNPFCATRYHSLAALRHSIPECLDVTAWTDDGEIMALQHHRLCVHGVQFHPESIKTEHGHDLLQNFLDSTLVKPEESLSGG